MLGLFEAEQSLVDFAMERHIQPDIPGTSTRTRPRYSAVTHAATRAVTRSALICIIGLLLALTGCGDVAAVRPTPEPVLTREPVGAITPRHPDDPVETLAEFYHWYTSYPGSPLDRYSYRSNEFIRPYLTADLVRRVDQTLATWNEQEVYDPFLCGQPLPTKLEYELDDIEGERADVLVRRYYPGSVQPAVMLVELVQSDGKWRIDNTRCLVAGDSAGHFGSVPTVHVQEQDTTGANTPFPGDWNTYRSSHNFHIAYPAIWEVREDWVSEPLDNDPIDGYIDFVGANGSVPVALVLSTGSMDSFRLVFPEPEGEPRTRMINGYEVLMEEHFNGEQYAIFLHPDDDERRVALRVITRGRPLDANTRAILDRMLASFAFTD